MNRIESGSLKQNMKIDEHCPGIEINGAFNELRHQQRAEKMAKVQDQFKRNEKTAKNIINQLPPETLLTITRRCDEELGGEISYQVIIKSKNEKNLVFGIPNVDADEKKSYTAFCMETKLMIRDKNEELIINQEMLEKIHQTHASMPQTRQTAA